MPLLAAAHPVCRGMSVTLDATRVAGSLAFGAAALACLRAARVAPRGRVLWWVLGTVQLFCVLEVLFALRYELHDIATGLLQEHRWYASRGQWQAELLGTGLALIAAIAGWAAWRHRDDGARTAALAGTALGVSVLGAETISLHRIDALMYSQAGPFVVVVWLWLAAALVVVAAALAQRR
ncbi:MAG: hypothetical protein ABI520_14505 [Caldimonas sp.]